MLKECSFCGDEYDSEESSATQKDIYCSLQCEEYDNEVETPESEFEEDNEEIRNYPLGEEEENVD